MFSVVDLFVNFNSHAHVERDFTWENLPDTIDISTHTLTWSVTAVCEQEIKGYFNFNSHAHVERDLDVVYIWCLLNVMRTYFFI